MAFLEDPRLRQRWNQISHTTEAVTENAAAGIWSFGHTYVNPCVASLASAVDCCTAPCLGDREDRARRQRDRERARGNAEYSFDFYDDWDEDLYGEDRSGLLGGWRNEDWDRLLAGTGRSARGAAGEVLEQPRSRKRGMSYGTRGARRKSAIDEDPTVIPSTAPIGFLGKLPFKFRGTLRYKPSAANLQEHPGATKHMLEGENEPLLGTVEEQYQPAHSLSQTRQRSGTAGSGATSDSYRSRNDLFPSDGEGDFEDDAVPLDDEFAVALNRVDDGTSSGRTKSSKGKRVAGHDIPRNESRTTLSSAFSRYSSHGQASSHRSPDVASVGSLEELEEEEERIRQEEDLEIERKRQAAAQLAVERGLERASEGVASVPENKVEVFSQDAVRNPGRSTGAGSEADGGKTGLTTKTEAHVPPRDEINESSDLPGADFIPARLPFFR